MEIFSAIARPMDAVECKFDDSQPKRGGMQAKEPQVATIRQP
jgi:hypothetical protein